MDNVNVFEQATRLKLRFDTQAHNGLSVEQLWDLPMQSTRPNQSDLEGAGKVVKKALREQDEDSIVSNGTNTTKALLELKLAVLIAIVEYKKAENAAKLADANRAQERATLRGLLMEKHAEEMKNLTKEQIEAKLKELGG
jgi:hypothetical protein